MSKREEMLKQSEASEPEASVSEEQESKNVDGSEVVEGRNDEIIIKELKKVRRQNFVTHCLLSVMIVLTAAWQLSQVSIMLKVKDGINHPFRSVGNMFKKMLVPDMNANAHQPDHKERDSTEPPSLPSIDIPEMPSINVPTNLGLQN